MRKLLLSLLLINVVIIPNVYGADGNTFTGIDAGASVTTATHDTFTGYKAGNATTTGDYNTFTGGASGILNVGGSSNTFDGYGAGYMNTEGDSNTYIGMGAGNMNLTGSENTSVGRYAGGYNMEGSGGIYLGYEAGKYEMGSNKLYIDNSDTSTPLIYGDFNLDLLKIYGDLEVTGSLISTEVSDNTTNISSNDIDIATINTNIGDRTYTQDNYVTDGESLTSSIDSLDQQTFTNTNNISTNRNLINNNSQRLNDHEERISNLEETEVNLAGEIQFIRKKNYTISTCVKYDVRHSRIPEVGLKFTIGLGKSWTQKELERLETKINKIGELLQQDVEKRDSIETKVIKTDNGFRTVIDRANTIKLLKKF